MAIKRQSSFVCKHVRLITLTPLATNQLSATLTLQVLAYVNHILTSAFYKRIDMSRATITSHFSLQRLRTCKKLYFSYIPQLTITRVLIVVHLSKRDALLLHHRQRFSNERLGHIGAFENLPERI